MKHSPLMTGRVSELVRGFGTMQLARVGQIKRVGWREKNGTSYHRFEASGIEGIKRETERKLERLLVKGQKRESKGEWKKTQQGKPEWLVNSYIIIDWVLPVWHIKRLGFASVALGVTADVLLSPFSPVGLRLLQYVMFP